MTTNTAKQRVAYISGPYRASTIRQVVLNIRAAEEVAIQLWQMGFAVICPHTNTQLIDGIFSGIERFEGISNGQHFINGDKEILNRLIPGYDIIVMLPGYLKSEGARQELKCAIGRGLLFYEWVTGKGKLEELKELGKDGKAVDLLVEK